MAPSSQDPSVPTSERDQCLAEFIEVNRQIHVALEEEDCDSVLSLIEQRAPMIEALVQFHDTEPFEQGVTRRIAAGEKELQEKVMSLKGSVGHELRKVVHSIQSVNKYKKVSEDTHPKPGSGS